MMAQPVKVAPFLFLYSDVFGELYYDLLTLICNSYLAKDGSCRVLCE